MRQTAVLLMLSALLFGCAAEDFTEIQSRRSPLIADLWSYSRQSEIKEVLDLPSWNVLNEARLGPDDQRPPYTLVSVSVSYSHLGYAGTLELDFYNDRLMTAMFCPDNFEGYLQNLAAEGLTGDRDRDVAIPPATLIRWAKNSMHGSCVQWTDKRLQDQESRWVMKYS
jgi:hypothetical protein